MARGRHDIYLLHFPSLCVHTNTSASSVVVSHAVDLPLQYPMEC